MEGGERGRMREEERVERDKMPLPVWRGKSLESKATRKKI